MDKIQKLKQEKQYEQYVKEKTPRHNLFLNMCKAFFLGGLICLLGQVIYHYFELRNLSPDECQPLDVSVAHPFKRFVHRNRNLPETCRPGEAPERSCRSPDSQIQ